MGNGTQKPADRLNIKGIAAGFGKTVMDGSGRNVLLPVENGYEYLTGIVVDVIDNPRLYFLDSNRRNSVISTLSDDDQRFSMIEKTPRNSVICQIIDLGQNEYNSNQIICFPFFPPHLSLPIKPGEHIWVLKETTGDISRYYWMCRKHSAYHVDNLNLNCHEREFAIYNSIDLCKVTKTEIDQNTARANNFDFPNFVRQGVGIPSLDKSKIYKNSHAFKNLTTEPVPDLAKDCGDLILQGSNNATIQLGQEKFGQSLSQLRSRYPAETFTGGGSPANTARTPFSPAIDICVARKKSELITAQALMDIRNSEEDLQELDPSSASSLGPVNVASEGMHFIKNSHKDPDFETYEINKMPEYLKDIDESYSILQDYDVNIKNCGARVYLSNNCEIDNAFNIGTDPESEEIIFKRYGGAIFSTYSEHTRLVSEGTFRVVNSFSNEEEGTSGSTYIEIDELGIVSIGSLNGNVPSEGEEAVKSGMQPFVKGDELESLMDRLITELENIIDILNDNFSSNVTPGFGSPNVPLITAGIKVQVPKEKLTTIKSELNKFKSTLIRGE